MDAEVFRDWGIWPWVYCYRDCNKVAMRHLMQKRLRLLTA